MITLSVPDMHCEKCVARITNGLNEASIPFEISLADQTVAVDEANLAAAIEELDDLGFSAQQN